MKTRFKGHETFYFREGWLSKALFEIHANKNSKLFAGNNGIAKLGVGSNMVKAIKYWLVTSNLVKRQIFELTPLGEKIAQYDPYLDDEFSLWIIHLNIVRNFENATTWNVFFNQMNATSFTSSDIKDVLKHYLDQNDITFSEKSLEADITVLLNMYSRKKNSNDPEENNSCPLERLNLIKLNRNIYTREIPVLDEIDELVVLYAIKLMMNERNTEYISISELESGKDSLASLFNFNRIIINEYLEQLANQSLIRIEKTAGLDMVYLTTTKTEIEIIETYYERSVKDYGI